MCIVTCAGTQYPRGWLVRADPPAAITLGGGTATFNATLTSLTFHGCEIISNWMTYDEFVLEFEYHTDGTWSASASALQALQDGSCHVTCSTVPKASYGQWQSINCAWDPPCAAYNVAFGINLTP